MACHSAAEGIGSGVRVSYSCQLDACLIILWRLFKMEIRYIPGYLVRYEDYMHWDEMPVITFVLLNCCLC
jgi:hypothetical protein